MKTKLLISLSFALFLFLNGFSAPVISDDCFVKAKYPFISDIQLSKPVDCTVESFYAPTCTFTLLLTGITDNTSYRISWDFDGGTSDASIIYVDVPFSKVGPSSGGHTFNYTIYTLNGSDCIDSKYGVCQ